MPQNVFDFFTGKSSHVNGDSQSREKSRDRRDKSAEARSRARAREEEAAANHVSGGRKSHRVGLWSLMLSGPHAN